MSAGLFEKEVIEEVPSADRWACWGQRKVRSFFKGPDAGINPKTGIIVLAHGMGGRQNDVSWKRLRKELANQCNAIVLGVNYAGTKGLERDMPFLNQQFSAMLPGLQAIAAHRNTPQGGLVDLRYSEFSYFENQVAAVQSALPFAWDFWDFGFLQALDVLNALTWLNTRLKQESQRVEWQRVHLLTRSAGAQVGYQLLKLAPNTFAGMFDVGGIAYSVGDVNDLAFALDDPYGRVNRQDNSSFIMEHPHAEFAFDLSRRVPTGNFRVPIPTQPSFADQVQIRLVDNPHHHQAGQRCVGQLNILHGADDEVYAFDRKRALAGFYARQGCATEVRAVASADVDARLFTGNGHTFMGDFNAIATELCAESFMRLREDGESDIASDTQRWFASKNGQWAVELTERAEFRWQGHD